MIFEGFFRDHRTKKSCIGSEKEWAKYGTLGYTTGEKKNAEMDSLIETA